LAACLQSEKIFSNCSDSEYFSDANLTAFCF
jgi:hypothetical protein